MTDSNYTAICILVDRSGSMIKIKNDAEGGIASFLSEQANLPGKATARLAEFDTYYDLVYPSKPLQYAPRYQLHPRGGTALLDALGRSVTEFGQELAQMPEDERPGAVLFVVMTDGQENSSYEWTKQQVNDLITQQREVYNWNFVFLGANQDAIVAGQSLGFTKDSSLTYSATKGGVASALRSVSSYTTVYRGAPGSNVSFTSTDRTNAVDQ